MARPTTVFTTAVLSGATQSSAIDLGQSWQTAYLVIQSMTSNSQLHLKASDAIDGTYRRVYQALQNTNTVAAPASFSIASALTNAIVPLPQGLRFVRVEQTATADSGQTYKIIVSGG